MDLKSWDYVDPRIASRLVDLEKARKHIGQEHNNLKKNNRLQDDMKNKLLEQNRHLQSKIKHMMQKEKMSLVDYYDQQIIVVTKNKEQQKVPTLHINREDESTIDHSKIMEQLKTSTTRRNRMAAAQDIAVKQFSIREDERKQSQKPEKAGDLYRSRYFRLKRKLKRTNALFTRRKHRKIIMERDKSSISKTEYNKSLLSDSPYLIQQQSDFQQMLNEYRQRQQQNQEYIDLLKKKIQAVTQHYQQREVQLQNKLKLYAERLGKIADDHSRLQQLQTQNETLRLQRDQLLKMLRKFV